MNFNKDKFLHLLDKIEPFYFYLFIIINTLPIFTSKYFFTVDGPAHLYNSRLIFELLNNNVFLSDYYKFNQISPNWLGHIILVAFLKIFPAFIAEKIIILIYLIGFPLSFRALIKSLHFNNRTMLYFIFPFTCSFLFFFGFYNFSLGLVFFFWALALYIRYNGVYNFKRITILLILSTLICFSHVFTFFIYIIIIFILNLNNLKSFFNSDSKIKSIIYENFLNQLIFLSIGIILIINFIFSNIGNSQNNLVYLNPVELFNWILEVQPAKGISYGKASIFTRWIFYSLLFIFIYLIVNKIYLFVLKKHKTKLNAFPINNYWSILSIISLILLFMLPDGNASFGFISSRMLLFFFFFLIIWFSTQKLPVWLKIITFLIINYVNIALVKLYFLTSQSNNNISSAICNAADQIEPNSVVLPLNYSDNKLFDHASNYLGIDKPMIVLDNYEATLNYFPLKWNFKSMPNLTLPFLSYSQSCFNYPKNEQNKKKYIDYIFIINNKENNNPVHCKNETDTLLSSFFQLKYANDDRTIQLYKKIN